MRKAIPPSPFGSPLEFKLRPEYKQEHGYWRSNKIAQSEGSEDTFMYTIGGDLYPDGQVRFMVARWDYRVDRFSSVNTEIGLVYDSQEAAQEACLYRHREGHWIPANFIHDLGLPGALAVCTEKRARQIATDKSGTQAEWEQINRLAGDYLRMVYPDKHMRVLNFFHPYDKEEDSLFVRYEYYNTHVGKSSDGNKHVPLWVFWKGVDWLRVRFPFSEEMHPEMKLWKG